MPDARQLAMLESLAAERCDANAIALANARRALGAAEQQLALLKRYESGYHVQLGERIEASIAIESLRTHHRFMGNVAAAVHQQVNEDARRRAAVDAAEHIWREGERRREGYRAIAAKAVRVARVADDRRQQKQSDEFASRRLQRMSAGF